MNVADLSDADLDNAFAASHGLGDYITADFYGAEIRDRLISVRSFIGGLFSSESRFPKYERVTQFSQSSAARESVSTAAQNVADTAKNAITLGGGITIVILLAGVALFAFAYAKGSK